MQINFSKSFKMIKVLITGANGYVGKKLIKKYKKKINFKIYKNDINNKNKLIKFINNNEFQYFIHLAGLLRTTKKKAKTIYKTNSYSLEYISKTLNKLDKKLIFLSSSHVYKPISKKLSENDKLQPNNIYGKSKLKAENIILKNTKDFCILRLFNLFGSYQPVGSFYSDIKNKINNNKKIYIDNSIKDFVHIDDLCDIIFFIIKNKSQGIFNVCTGQGVCLKNIIYHLERKLKKKAKIQFSNTKTLMVGNNRKISKLGLKIKYKNILNY